MRGGFQYTPPRPIQYGRINPLQGLYEGVSRGMQLGMQRERQAPPDMFVQAPGKFEDMDKSEYLSQEKSDLETLSRWEQKQKGDSKEQKALNYQDLIKSGQIRSKLVQNALASGVTTKELQETFDALQSNDPLAPNMVGRLRNKMGYWYDKKEKTYKGKGVALADKEKEILLGREEGLARYLDNMLDFHANPQKYSRQGRLNPKMIDAIKQQEDALEELTRLNPDRAKEFAQKLKYLRQPKGGADQTGKRIQYVAQMDRFYKDHRFTNPELAAQALQIKKNLLSRGGRLRQSEFDEMQRILGKKSVGKSRSLKKGKIYKDAAGNRARFGGYDASGNEIWNEL